MKHDLQSIFEAVLVGIVVLDRDGGVEFLNSEAARILESSQAQLLGTQFVDHLGPRHPLTDVLTRVATSGRASIHDDLDFPQRLAPSLTVDVAVAPIRDPSPEGGVVVSLQDRSASQSLREEIRERERQESYGHIAAGIAHEVKNPLGGIRGAAELLGLAAQNDRGRKTSKLIVDEVDRISRLVDEMMIFARGDHLELESVNIHRLLDSLLDLLEFERFHEDIEIVRTFDPSLPEIEADPARLQQVFLNLARNALQAMEDGGTLTLTTRMLLEHRIVSAQGRPMPTIEIGFSDTGPGIPAEIRDRLSTPFFTTKKKGTGLGLSLARHWVRRHGGRLRIDSEEGQGTRVRVDLPMNSPKSAPQTTDEAAATKRQKREKEEVP